MVLAYFLSKGDTKDVSFVCILLGNFAVLLGNFFHTIGNLTMKKPKTVKTKMIIFCPGIQDWWNIHTYIFGAFSINSQRFSKYLEKKFWTVLEPWVPGKNIYNIHKWIYGARIFNEFSEIFKIFKEKILDSFGILSTRAKKF